MGCIGGNWGHGVKLCELGAIGNGPENLKLSESMTWSDQNCPIKGAYFALCFFGKVRIILRHFHKHLFYFLMSDSRKHQQLSPTIGQLYTSLSK